MNKNEAAFVEGFIEYGKQTGLARNTARILAWLVICQPASQTSHAIQEKLAVSAGTVSGAAATLKAMELIVETRQVGDRRMYYELQPGGFVRASEQRLNSIRLGKKLAQQRKKSDAHNLRLEKMLEIYTVAEGSMEDLMAKLRTLQ
jgi:DNA-binding transcriptional regulator GbsR (MarR family)